MFVPLPHIVQHCPWVFPPLHRLQVVVLLDLRLSLLAHGSPQLFTHSRRLNVLLHGCVLPTGKVDRLLLERHLGCECLEVAFSEESCF